MSNVECRRKSKRANDEFAREFDINLSFVIRASSFHDQCLKMTWLEICAADFDLAITLNSGQVFHWEKVGEGFYGTIGDRGVYVEQRGAKLWCAMHDRALRPRGKEDSNVRKRPRPATAATAGRETLAPPSAAEIIRHYFAFDHPLNEICASFPQEAVMNAAREFCYGLRIIRQPKWECLATFICSSMKQVAHIRQISRALRQQFGIQKEVRGRKTFLFPPAERLAKTSESDLRKCGLGYRARTLLATAKYVASGQVSLSSWNDQLREQLCQLPGVGTKVANCVMLFSYERVRAFPIDVWIERVLREKYFAQKRKVTSATLAGFAAKHFGPYGGYAQQYLFHHARMTKMK
jgi:N-glycosylase/DNA lyase